MLLQAISVCIFSADKMFSCDKRVVLLLISEMYLIDKWTEMKIPLIKIKYINSLSRQNAALI